MQCFACRALILGIRLCIKGLICPAGAQKNMKYPSPLFWFECSTSKKLDNSYLYYLLIGNMNIVNRETVDEVADGLGLFFQEKFVKFQVKIAYDK